MESEVTKASRIPNENSYILYCTLCCASKLTLLTILRPSRGHLFKIRTSKSHASAPGGSFDLHMWAAEPAVNCICLQRSAYSPLLAACSLEQQQDQPALSKTSTVLFVQCHCISRKTYELFLGIFLYCYLTAELALSQCAAQFCSFFFFLREEDSITIQLGHAGRDGPGS